MHVCVFVFTMVCFYVQDCRFQAPQGLDFYLKVMLEFFKHQSQVNNHMYIHVYVYIHCTHKYVMYVT